MKRGQFEKGDHVAMRESQRIGMIVGFCPVDGWPRVRWQWGGETFVKPDCLKLDDTLGATPTRKKQTAN